MTSKISDFKVAEYILRLFCKTVGCHFVDLPIEFAEGGVNKTALENSRIVLSHTDTLAKTLFKIITTYLQHIAEISGSQSPFSDEMQQTLINLAVAMIRDFVYSDETFSEALTRLPVSLRLNRDPFIWFALRDIVCPAYQKPLFNANVIAGKSPISDAAQLVEQETSSASIVAGGSETIVSTSEQNLPFIFVNMEVENYAYRSAFILREAIRVHGLNPSVVIKDLLTKTELSDKFLGLAKIALVRDIAIKDFIMMLGILSDFESAFMVIGASAKVTDKNAQTGTGGGFEKPTSSYTSFWQLGITEKMLGPVQKSDWSTYFRMKPFTERLWEKIEAEKKKRGLKELPLEILLRVQSEQYKTRPDLIVQGLLADTRVW